MRERDKVCLPDSRLELKEYAVTFVTNYPKSGQTSLVKGSFPQDCPHSICQLQTWGSQVTVTSDQLAVNLGLLTTPSG